MKVVMERYAAPCFCSIAVCSCCWAVTLVSPTDDHEVALLPDAQKTVLSTRSHSARVELFKKDAAGPRTLKNDKHWRESLPVVFEWQDDEKGPWEMKIGKCADFDGATVIFVSKCEVDAKTGKCRYVWQNANLEIGTRYFWQITSGVKCPVYGHGRKCSCTNRIPERTSLVASFRTEGMAPRWIALEGRVHNIRDLGGRTAMNGMIVRQGLIFRGEGLNDNSVTGDVAGRNRLMVEDVEYLTRKLGVRTELDLRTGRETAGAKKSVLGDTVAYIQCSSHHYKGIFGEDGKRKMGRNFRLFCDRRNYPIYFHCIAGADRTGSLAYVLNGILGVSQDELETDWESTFYPRLPSDTDWRRLKDFDEGFAKYGQRGDTLCRKIELYLLECGVLPEEIEEFRRIMLKSLEDKCE